MPLLSVFIFEPLTTWQQKDECFHWGQGEEKGVIHLKQALTSALAFAQFSQELPTKIHTDSNRYKFGAVLIQKQGSVYYIVAYHLPYIINYIQTV